MTSPVRPWWRWPENHRTGYVPWFVILRRLVGTPFMLIGIMIAFIGFLLVLGWRETTDLWEEKL